MCEATRDWGPFEYRMIGAHELGHGVMRMVDMYLLDLFGNGDGHSIKYQLT